MAQAAPATIGSDPDHTGPTRDADAAAAALEVRNLEAGYHRQAPVLRGISLTVAASAAVAVLGPNGAGKTTTLRAISGLLDSYGGEIRKGTVQLDGADRTGTGPATMVRHGLAQVPEGRQVFPALSVDENLRAGAHTRRHDRAGIATDLHTTYDRFPALAERRHTHAGLLSGGEQQMLAIARALMARPRILLLDEPSLGLAPQLVDTVADTIATINHQGTTILLVEQNARMALTVAQYGYVLERGRIVLDGTAQNLRDNDDIREFYLGLGADPVNYRTIKHYRRRKRWLS